VIRIDNHCDDPSDLSFFEEDFSVNVESESMLRMKSEERARQFRERVEATRNNDRDLVETDQ